MSTVSVHVAAMLAFWQLTGHFLVGYMADSRTSNVSHTRDASSGVTTVLAPAEQK